MARLILLVVVVAVGLWLYKNSAGGFLGSRKPDSSVSAPAARARAAARAMEQRQAETDRLGREAASPREPGRVHENMTPAEVRTLLGPPDEVTAGFSSSGAAQEIWLYKSVGKRVVFENGVAIRVE